MLMKSLGSCKVNKFSGYGNRIPEEAVFLKAPRAHDSKQKVVVHL